jgi:chemotaxis response regulator CheB
LLDLQLAREDGMQIARDLRSRSKLPIIILTGRHEEADRVMGLELGADDYLTKTFSPRELLARIRALLRRTRMHESVAEKVAHIRAYRFAGWELNLRIRRLARESGEVVPLRNGEFNLLLGFLASRRRRQAARRAASCRAPRALAPLPVNASAGGLASIRSKTARTSSAPMSSTMAIVSAIDVTAPLAKSSSTACSMVA